MHHLLVGQGNLEILDHRKINLIQALVTERGEEMNAENRLLEGQARFLVGQLRRRRARKHGGGEHSAQQRGPRDPAAPLLSALRVLRG
jgi:hypothetical protein